MESNLTSLIAGMFTQGLIAAGILIAAILCSIAYLKLKA